MFDQLETQREAILKVRVKYLKLNEKDGQIEAIYLQNWINLILGELLYILENMQGKAFVAKFLQDAAKSYTEALIDEQLKRRPPVLINENLNVDK